MNEITISFETKEELDIFKLILDGIEDFNGTIKEYPVDAKDEVEAEEVVAEDADFVEPETVTEPV